MTPRSPSSTRYATLFGIAAGMLLLAVVTGIHLRIFPGVEAFSQWVLLGHLLSGILLPLPLLVYLVYHLVVVASSPVLRGEWVSHGLGTLTALAIGLAAGSGTWLAVGSVTSIERPPWILAHQVAAYGSCVLLAVHLAVALRRRLRQGRASLLPATARIHFPVSLCVTSVSMLAILAWVVPADTGRLDIPGNYTFVKNKQGTRAPFFPGLASTAHDSLIPVDNLAGSVRCGECHRDIYRQWRSSSHSFAASNDHYLAQTRLRIHDVPIKPHLGARFCANCHEPIALFAGELDPQGRGVDVPENRDEGLSCLACHRIQQLQPGHRGNGDYVIAPHRPTLFEREEHPVKRALGQLMIRSRPATHREAMMRDLLRSADFCSTCHQVFNDETINGRGHFQQQDTFAEWKASSHAATKRCQDCHMPLVASDDPAAREYPGEGGNVRKVHDHRFFGANTARPFLDGDREMLEATRRFLESGVVGIEIHPPTDPPPGATARVEVVVTNTGVGHHFPTGTTDMHDVWVELIANAVDGRVLLHSGSLGPGGHLDPTAHRFASRAVDDEGAWLFRRDLWNTDRYASSDLIPAGGSRTLAYEIPLPRDATGPIALVARVQYRKSNQEFTDFVLDRRPPREGGGYGGSLVAGVRLPVTTMAEARETMVLPAPR